MSTKPKTSDAKALVLKGQEAEDKVLEYLKMMNRPFGAVDVAANLKGAVPKATTQKILVALAEKGEITQKTYGKTTFFVANQANLEDVPAEKLKQLEEEHKSIEESNKLLATDIKSASTDLAKLKATPTDAELLTQLEDTAAMIQRAVAHLEPLRSGSSLVSEDDLAQLDTDWVKWRAEWVRRKKIFNNFWSLATDALSPQDAAALAEDLGIETDTPEHLALEKGPLCAAGTVLGKRRR
ncbi:hypothetical protein EIP86_009170 [Pleurotus ostreatoroseus]|nr:hypothetical protein EIP86_009170 [Pleurotus ostreatoroseus]